MKKTCFFVAIVVLATCCGCGKKIVTVSGEVLYEGKPAKDIAVLFEPKSDAKFVSESGVTVTDSNGSFTLRSSSNKRGLEPGNYTVYMNWKNPNFVDITDGAGLSRGAEVKAMSSPYRFPAERPEIVVTVQNSGKNHFTFKITPTEILWE